MQLEKLPAAAPLRAWRVESGGFPVAGGVRERQRDWIRELLDSAAAESGGEALALLYPAASDAAKALIQPNAGRWRLRPGLGIRPEEPPPATPGVLDTMLAMLSRKRPQDLTLYRPGARVEAAEIVSAAAGSGGLVAVVCRGSADDCLSSMQAGLGAYLSDPVAQGKGFYAPLLSRAALQHPQAAASLGDALLYIRESVEDNELLVVATRDFKALRP